VTVGVGEAASAVAGGVGVSVGAKVGVGVALGTELHALTYKSRKASARDSTGIRRAFWEFVFSFVVIELYNRVSIPIPGTT